MFGAFRSTVRRSLRQTARTSGGHSGGPPFHGFNPPYVAPIHKNMGEIMMGVMWWVLYLFKYKSLFLLQFIHCCWTLSSFHACTHTHTHNDWHLLSIPLLSFFFFLAPCRFWIFYRAKEDGMAVLVSGRKYFCFFSPLKNVSTDL